MTLIYRFYLLGGFEFMNYRKLQLSFLLLLIMTIILSFTCLFIVKHFILTITSIIAMLLCITGLIYTLKAEHAAQCNIDSHKNKDLPK